MRAGFSRGAGAEAGVLRGQLLESSNRASTLEERANHLQVRLEEERQQSAREIKLITEAQRAFEMSFKSLSADALRNNNQSFLELAKASLAEFQQGARGDLEKRQVAIDALVAPVRASLDKVDEKIASLERARELAYGEIRAQFAQMAEVQTQLRDETGNLVKALRQPHVRGRWGEIQLRRVVEMAGMMPHCDFVEQQSAEATRPPATTSCEAAGQSPDRGDPRCPISALMGRAREATTTRCRKVKIQLLLLRNHAPPPGKPRAKAYWEQFHPRRKWCVMFIRARRSSARRSRPIRSCSNSGFGQNVIIASPASRWRSSRRPLRLARGSHRRQTPREISRCWAGAARALAVIADHFARVGKSSGLGDRLLQTPRFASFESRVLVSARKVQGLGSHVRRMRRSSSCGRSRRRGGACRGAAQGSVRGLTRRARARGGHLATAAARVPASAQVGHLAFPPQTGECAEIVWKKPRAIHEASIPDVAAACAAALSITAGAKASHPSPSS